MFILKKKSVLDDLLEMHAYISIDHFSILRKKNIIHENKKKKLKAFKVCEYMIPL